MALSKVFIIKKVPQLILLSGIVLLNSFNLISQNTLQENKPAIPNIEKVYLHTDRSYYNIGESLWYKAYMVYGYTNILFDNSNVLYVELISPDSKIITRNITRLETGLGHGDIKLSDSLGISAGTYQLRAYTNWMRNFGNDFIFKKEIEIFDLKKNETYDGENIVSDIPENNEQDKIHSKENIKPFNIQFFPEGGSLVEDVVSMVAFKATDNKGNPVTISGLVFDTNKNTVARLKSTHEGMGIFRLTPTKNQQYKAEIQVADGKKLEVLLPKPEKTGYVMSLKNYKGKHVITIATNEETFKQNSNTPLTMICTTRGITYFEGSQVLNQQNASFLLPTENIPEGISKITLYNEKSIPQCERLVYIEKDHKINVSITPNKNQYEPKEKVILNISAKAEHENPLTASFSIAAVDKNGIEDGEDYTTNICSYFLMESEIKGSVHNPGYYFNKANPNRLYDLDLLLLTQGWRDFLWKTLPEIKDSLSYKAEKGFKISGIVKELLGKDPKENHNVRLILINEEGESIMLDDTTNVEGRFKFDNIVFTGNSTMLLNTQNEKGKNRGMFILDSITQPPVAVDYKKNNSISSTKSNTIEENIYKKHVLFDVPVMNLLDEVVLHGKKTDGIRSKYGLADHTYIPKENSPNFRDIYQLIQFAIPGISVSGNTVRFSRYNSPTLIVIDDVISEMEDLEFVIPDDVAKIEALNSSRAAIFGSRGANGALVIYTKEGSGGSSKRNKTFHSIVKEIQGFYNARIFYSPNYDKPAKDIFEEEKADIRNTLYWNPDVHPDENGKAEVSYYNSEVDTTVKITLEGITDTGIPIVVKNDYTVEN
ncbi:TonB-dependent receptor [Abyssalbus ytuae]|uniref:TonB-dependent receptor plug domain-containing protein n=1 Tax=Abyssalbus ytuae TaxID=2926907 RepID=A0A9E7D0I1_9FLAO|nr:hypothetical protein [Abyssalbus ytuae]UOB18445.1 hypothetical protein MQE35_03935 [Abyssalbus ytuae]